MNSYVALLRAVNVGGTGKLPMTELRQMCEAAGFTKVRTYIASGNVVFGSEASEAEVQATLARRMENYVGKPVGVLVRSAAEMAEVAARNPFAEKAGNRTMALFVDDPLPTDALEGVAGLQDELLVLGRREIYIFYSHGMASSRLRIPAAKNGTARNMNTVAKLAEMAAAVGG
jgi:uncharacterized protein (DUF1697 family)